MVSKTMGHPTSEFPDLRAIQTKRDQTLALEYVQRGQSRQAVKEISVETGVHIRTVYRAIDRQLAWALAQTEAPTSDQVGG